MKFQRRGHASQRSPRMLILFAGVLLVAAAACGDGESSARSRSSQTSSGTGSNGPGSTTDVDTTGSSHTLAPRPSFAPGESGVTGIVGRNPCPTGDLRACDAQLEPLAATVIVTDPQTDTEIARAQSPPNGRYAIRLSAGNYRLEADPDATDLSCDPLDVIVPDADYFEANIECR